MTLGNVVQLTFDGTHCAADDVPSDLAAGSDTVVMTNLAEERVAAFGSREFVGEKENITEEQANGLRQRTAARGRPPPAPD